MASEASAWRYSINYGPEGEANYAFVYDQHGELVSNLKTHHAKAVVDAMNATPCSEQARDALTELDQLRDRVKELDKALEPFASEDFDLFDNMPDDEQLAILSGGLQIAHCTVGDLRTARRVREGGKVDG